MDTEGKWEVRRWDGDEWPDKRISVGPPGRVVAISPRYADVNVIDDMQLIASAPDPLEALEAIVAQDGYDGLDYFVGTDLSGRIKQTIAKAKGEQQ